MSGAPYFDDGVVQLWHGRLEDVLPSLHLDVDLVVADPPSGETKLAWDRWPAGWPSLISRFGARSMWCFGGVRVLLERHDEFADWRFGHDVVWEKHNGSSAARDRFRRVHETATHWYRGNWASVHHVTPTTRDATPRQVRRKARPSHWGSIGAASYRSDDGGPRLMRSVLYVRGMHGSAIHPTEKPTGILEPLIEYGCPPGGRVLDPFAGSCSTLVAARAIGRRAVGIEMREEQCELAARRLAQDVMDLTGTGLTDGGTA